MYRTPTNQGQSISTLYPEVHAALEVAGLLKGGNKLPKLGNILDTREQEIIAAELRKEE